MTQEKKFKKNVRARMAETGETYVRARKALLTKSEEPCGDAKYIIIGFWKSTEEPYFPDPLDFLDTSWDSQERVKVVAYLRAGHVVQQWMGPSWCRLGCSRSQTMQQVFFESHGTQDDALTVEERRQFRRRAAELSEQANMVDEDVDVDMGSTDLSDGTYLWPEGLAHYIEHHNVCLPKDFVEHVLKEKFPKEPPKKDVREGMRSETWWRQQRQKASGQPTADTEANKILTGDRRLTYNEDMQIEGAKELLILHDAESWAATGGTEEERQQALLEAACIANEFPREIEIRMPFNAGWYFHDAEYPDEGTVGLYDTIEEAKAAAREAEYDLDSVVFVKQKVASIIHRYTADHLRKEVLEAVKGVEGTVLTPDVWSVIKARLQATFAGQVARLESNGVLVPPESDFVIETLEAEEDTLRVSVRVENQERYPDLIREIADTGLLEHRYLLSTSLVENTLSRFATAVASAHHEMANRRATLCVRIASALMPGAKARLIEDKALKLMDLEDAQLQSMATTLKVFVTDFEED